MSGQPQACVSGDANTAARRAAEGACLLDEVVGAARVDLGRHVVDLEPGFCGELNLVAVNLFQGRPDDALAVDDGGLARQQAVELRADVCGERVRDPRFSWKYLILPLAEMATSGDIADAQSCAVSQKVTPMFKALFSSSIASFSPTPHPERPGWLYAETRPMQPSPWADTCDRARSDSDQESAGTSESISDTSLAWFQAPSGLASRARRGVGPWLRCTGGPPARSGGLGAAEPYSLASSLPADAPADHRKRHEHLWQRSHLSAPPPPTRACLQTVFQA